MEEMDAKGIIQPRKRRRRSYSLTCIFLPWIFQDFFFPLAFLAFFSSFSVAAHTAMGGAGPVLDLGDEVHDLNDRLGSHLDLAAAVDVGPRLRVDLQGLASDFAGEAEQVDAKQFDDVRREAELFLHAVGEVGPNEGVDDEAGRETEEESGEATRPIVAQARSVVVLPHGDRQAEGDVQAGVRLLQAVEEADAGATDAGDAGEVGDDLGIVDRREDGQDDAVARKCEEVLVPHCASFCDTQRDGGKALTSHFVCGEGVLEPGAVAIAPSPRVSLWALRTAGGVVAATIDIRDNFGEGEGEGEGLQHQGSRRASRHHPHYRAVYLSMCSSEQEGVLLSTD
mmetsp:Transcript_73937/g.154093  ORF Transcript_73937/g.154093 Transcript_73937/m.154093 type:complete len:339 (+) Transcript_73937:322-1338(+)